MDYQMHHSMPEAVSASVLWRRRNGRSAQAIVRGWAMPVSRRRRIGVLPDEREGEAGRRVDFAELSGQIEGIPLRRLHLDPVALSDARAELQAWGGESLRPQHFASSFESLKAPNTTTGTAERTRFISSMSSSSSDRAAIG